MEGILTLQENIVLDTNVVRILLEISAIALVPASLYGLFRYAKEFFINTKN